MRFSTHRRHGSGLPLSEGIEKVAHFFDGVGKPRVDLFKVLVGKGALIEVLLLMEQVADFIDKVPRDEVAARGSQAAVILHVQDRMPNVGDRLDTSAEKGLCAFGHEPFGADAAAVVVADHLFVLLVEWPSRVKILTRPLDMVENFGGGREVKLFDAGVDFGIYLALELADFPRHPPIRTAAQCRTPARTAFPCGMRNSCPFRSFGLRAGV